MADTEKNELHWGDVLVIVGYFISVIIVGIWVSDFLSNFQLIYFKHLELYFINLLLFTYLFIC